MFLQCRGLDKFFLIFRNSQAENAFEFPVFTRATRPESCWPHTCISSSCGGLYEKNGLHVDGRELIHSM